MASNGLAEAFARLSGSDSRQNALEAFLKELSPYEWRFIHSLTSARTFEFDIIGHLPVELVCQIFSYLDTPSPWRLQCVSQAWNQKLRSLSVLKCSLGRWYDSTCNLQGLDAEFCRRKARSVHSLHGRARWSYPDSSIKISPHSKPLRPFLVGDSLVWCVPDHRQVIVANLRSWATRILVDPGRGEIGELHAADDLVVFSVRAKGVVYVGELNKQGPLKSFRLQASSQKLVLTCRHRTVACAMHFEDYCTDVYIWDYDSSQGRSFQINRAAIRPRMSNLYAYGLLLQPDSETVILCEVFSTAPHTIEPAFLHWCFTYAGQCLWGRNYPYRSAHAHRDAWDDDLSSSLSFIPASHDGTYMLQRNTIWNNGATTVHSLQYDERTQSFQSPQHPRPHDAVYNDGNAVWWNDVFVEAKARREMIVLKGTVSAPTFDPYNMGYYDDYDEDDEDDGDVSLSIVMNDRYIIRLCKSVGTNGTIRGVGLWEIIKRRFPDVQECTYEFQ